MSTINRRSKYTTENASFWTCNYHQLVSVFCLVWYKCQCFHMFDRCYSKMPFGDTLFLILWKLSCRRVGQKFWHICCFVSSESCFEAKTKPGADVQKARQILWGCPPQIGVHVQSGWFWWRCHRNIWIKLLPHVRSVPYWHFFQVLCVCLKCVFEKPQLVTILHIEVLQQELWTQQFRIVSSANGIETAFTNVPMEVVSKWENFL